MQGGTAMKQLVIGSIVAVLITLGWGTLSFGQQVPTPQGELRIVDKRPGNFGTIVFNVFEHLLELDKDGTLVPRLATGWRWLNDRTLEITLRPGVKFHNGEVFDAEILKLNVEEQAQLRHVNFLGGFLSFKPGTSVEILDPHTVRLLLPEPDGAALARLSFLHLANRQFYRELGWAEKHW
jgi:ABC-type transport system substrate-binding protein